MHSSIQQGQQVIGDDPLNDVFVAKLQADPQSIQLGPGKKCFALGLEIIGEFANKINAANIFDGKVSLFPFGREQLESLRIAELAGVQVTAQDVAI